MRPGLSKLRDLFDAIGLFSFLNLTALGALVALAISSGAIDGEKLQRMVAIMRGESESPMESAAPSVEPTAPPEAIAAARDRVVESDVDKEILRREAERIKTELEQRMALNNSILLRVTAEREKFARERDEVQQAERVRRNQREAEGFRRQVQIFEALSPKIAVQHLMALESTDDGARLLVEMDTRKAKKLIEAAKQGPELTRMQSILRRLREVAPEESAVLEAED